MNNLAKTLLAGSALCALTTAPAMAQNVPAFPVTALHAGHVVNKTKLQVPGRQHLTYTFGVSTYIPAELDKKVKLLDTLYKWTSSLNCPLSEKPKIKKKPIYGKVGFFTETYSEGCSSGPTVYYGNTYKLTNPEGEGKTDSFVSALIGKFQNNGVKYRGKLNLDVSVEIGE